MRHRVDLFLAPGEMVVRAGTLSVKTIVGSCVAVCLWDRKRRVGGVNHFLLPHPNPNDQPDGRFGSSAMRLLLDKIGRLGATSSTLQAAVVGGGRPLDTSTPSGIGDTNTAVALGVLRERGIHITRQETGGCHGRKLLFNTGTGELLIRDLRGWAEAQAARVVT